MARPQKLPKSNIRSKTSVNDLNNAALQSEEDPGNPRQRNLHKFESILASDQHNEEHEEKEELPLNGEEGELTSIRRSSSNLNQEVKKLRDRKNKEREGGTDSNGLYIPKEERRANTLTHPKASPRKPGFKSVAKSTPTSRGKRIRKAIFGGGSSSSSSKGQPLGKELWGSRIIEESLTETEPVEYFRDFQPQILRESFGWEIEKPSVNEELVARNSIIEFKQFESIYYITEFYEKEHINYFASDKVQGEVIASFRKDKSKGLVYVIYRTKKGSIKMEIPLSTVKKFNSKTIIKELAFNEGRYPNLTLTNIRLVDAPALEESLVTFEKADVFKRYKFGVLLVQEGQTNDDEFFANCEGSHRYNEFLKILGKEITLQGWKKYAGGLDTSSGSTGTHSIYNCLYSPESKYEIMFHVSTMLPFHESDKQRVERKRHLGNDVVNIIFNDSSAPFDPASIITNFIHVYIVVQVDEEATAQNLETYYRVEVTSQAQVPRYNPPLNNPPIFSASELREWLPYKLINAERASFLAPAIRFKLNATRKQILTEIFAQFDK